ncbi:MAG: ribonuclease III [Phycisphaerales bacterium]|nr:MAG: ribonuclease III [Phycisphaerales bacterium]
MDDATRQAAEHTLGYRFKNPELLARSLRHASVTDDRLESNERMEFLGDAVLGMVACDLIYQGYPDHLEGDMTKLKSTVVSRRTCARIARQLGLEDMLELGKGMRNNCDRLPCSLSACVLEAVIAAVYLDGGIDAARAFLEPLLEPCIDEAANCGHQQNFKSVLQQHATGDGLAQPTYRVLDEQGPDHAKAFKVAVEIDTRRFPPSWGNNKKAAEQQAALNALRELGVVEPTGRDGEVRVITDAK